MNHTSLKTPHLTITPTDLNYLEILLNDKRELEPLLGVKVPESYPESADALPWFCGLMRDDPSLLGWLHFHAIHDEGQTLVGDGGFKGKPDQTGLVEIGYSIVPEFRGRGYATEIAQALIAYAFSHPEVSAVAAHTNVDNIGSIKVLERAGMKIVGEVEDPEDGRLWQWRLTREEYRS